MATVSQLNSPDRTSSTRTEIVIHVYDLLPVCMRKHVIHSPIHTNHLKSGAFASTLWFLGSSLLHTGVVIRSREYAYGGHDRPGVSGVYWTKPRLEPPGGRFRCELRHGFTSRSEEEIEIIVRDVSQEFPGTSYNLLSNNCNHFTSYLCSRLTSNPAPSWLNRAASIGLALPCVVPREWVTPPDHETVDGELLEEDEEDENALMLKDDKQRGGGFLQSHSEDIGQTTKRGRRDSDSRKALVSVRDADGRFLPVSERAPRSYD